MSAMLLVDESTDSRKAIRMLSAIRLDFQIVPASGSRVPSLFWEGETYTGLPSIAFFTRSLSTKKGKRQNTH